MRDVALMGFSQGAMTVLFPGLLLPLHIFEDRYRRLVRDLLELPHGSARRFGVVGIREGRGAKFVKRYADLLDDMTAGVAAYAADVRARRYPGPEHGYTMPSEEMARFLRPESES